MKWRLQTNDDHPVMLRWRAVWLPALIYKGVIDPAPEYTRKLKAIAEAKSYVINAYRNKSGLLEQAWRPVAIATNRTPKVLEMRKHALGNNLYFGKALMAAYTNDQIKQMWKRYRNESFSLLDFLQYVLWTRNMRLMSLDWTPMHQECEPCRVRYHYVMRAEHPEESYYQMTVLGAVNYTLKKRHVSMGSPSDPFDISMYKTIPEQVMERVIDMYKLDFELFGYDKNYM